VQQTPRDGINTGDRVGIYIDFDADAQVAYEVTISLAGSLRDAIVTNENLFSTDWDGEVHYAVRQGQDAWFAEVLIPWTVAPMKNSDTPRRVIAVAFDRVLGATQERSALRGVSFTQPRYVSEFPTVEIEQFPTSLLSVFPYASFASDWLRDRLDARFGADVFWKPSARFQVIASLRPDFGHVEADELVVNFSALETLFSDKRPFFAENQSLFDVRVPRTSASLLTTDRLLYTRRVGGPRDDGQEQAAELDAAVKLSGSLDNLDYGVLAAVEDEYSADIGRAFIAQRLRYSSRSWTVGYLGTWADRPFLERTAQAHSADVTWRPNERLMVQAQAIASVAAQSGERSSGDGQSWLATYTPDPDWQHELGMTHFSSTLNFNDFGFQQRASLNRASYVLTRRFRELEGARAGTGVVWRVRPELLWNDSGDRLGHFVGISREAQRPSGAFLKSSLELTGAGVDDLISRGHGVVRVKPRLAQLGHLQQTPLLGKWRLLGSGTLFQEGNDDYAFFLESKVEHFTRPDFNWSFGASMLWSRDWLIWRQDDLLATFHRTRAQVTGDMNWFPAASHELRLKLQWLAIDARTPTALRIDPHGRLIEVTEPVEPFRVNNLGLQIRYRWTYAPQSDLYVVYGRGGILLEEGRSHEDLVHLLSSAARLRDSDQLLVKVNYRF
jgi:hypothetical protein